MLTEAEKSHIKIHYLIVGDQWKMLQYIDCGLGIWQLKCPCPRKFAFKTKYANSQGLAT